MAAFPNDEDTDIEEGGEDGLAQTFRWDIEDFPALQRELRETNNMYASRLSEVFIIGGCKWQLLLFPYGNGDGRANFLSLYLLVSDKDELPEGWRREARFWLYIINHKDEKQTVRQQTSTVSTDSWEDHKPPEPFSAKKHDWGFPKMIQLSKLREEDGFLEGGKLTIQAEIMVFRHWIDYRSLRTQRLKSRQETGYVGIYNQGATCYLNAWLQALFHCGSFRRAVYQIPTAEANLATNIPLALQRLFYRLQFHEDSVETKELTTAFRWTPADVAQQHDVHELNCKLLDNLEKKMKGTPADGAIEKMFRGEIINYINCLNVDYKSEVPEAIYDIGLVVKGCADVYESFEKYVSFEILDGPNQYRAEGFGLQDAKKGLRISKLPPVLMLHLQRWELDMVRFVTYKVNDKHRFYPVLDLSRFLPPDYPESSIYHLHAILVHTGVAGAGHYYAYVRPNTKSNWFLFDDSRVAMATEKQAIDDNWGGFEEHTWIRFGQTIKWTHPRSANAYMLLYVRETEAHQYMGSETGEDVIPEHIHKVGEEHLYMDLHVAQSKDLHNHDQNKFGLLARKDLTPIKVLRNTTVIEFMQDAATRFQIPAEHQRYWLWRSRDTRINLFRPLRPLKPLELENTLESLSKSIKFHDSHKILYLEDTRMTGDIPSPGLGLWDDAMIFLFFKFYDPETQKIEYVGSHVFNSISPLGVLTSICNTLKGFPVDTALNFWEEFSPDEIKRLSPFDASLDSLDLNTGDVIIFSKELPPEAHYQLPDPRAWFSWKRHGMKVRFRKHETPTDASTEFTLELSKKMAYDAVAIQVAHHLGLDDHRKLRFSGLSAHHDGPRPDPCRPDQILSEMLSHYHFFTSFDILFYEILPVPLSELNTLKQLNLCALDSKGQQIKSVRVFIAKDRTLGDALAQALEKVEASAFPFGTREFRLMEIFSHLGKPSKYFKQDTPISMVSTQQVFFEEISQEELELNSEAEDLIHVSHFVPGNFGNYRPMGSSFRVIAKFGETVAALKERVKARLGVSEEDFNAWKFVFIDPHIKTPKDDYQLTEQNITQWTVGLLHDDDDERLPQYNWHTPAAHEERTLKFGDDD